MVSRRGWRHVAGDAVVEVCMMCDHFAPTGPADLALTLSNLLSRPIASVHFNIQQGSARRNGVGSGIDFFEVLSNRANLQMPSHCNEAVYRHSIKRIVNP